ncbi:MAG TPA: hypothetical protein VH619_06150 [Verrucomicrobiae bacterium]|nr:hypothetical protein [Verrucomicrobiae bacterium]
MKKKFLLLFFCAAAILAGLNGGTARAGLADYVGAANTEATLTFLATNVAPLPLDVDIGTLAGNNTYEFIANSPSDPTGSEALMGWYGSQDQAIKFEQYDNSGTYGATEYGIADYAYSAATTFGSNVVLDFVANKSTGKTQLFVNGVQSGSPVPFAVSLSGWVTLGGSDGGDGFFSDNFNGTILAVATYNSILTASEIQAHYNAFIMATPLTASAGAVQSMCMGGEVMFGGAPTATGGAGGYTYSWSPAAGLSSATAANPTASPASTTTYTVTVTDSQQSTATSSVTVTVSAGEAATASAGGNQTILAGGNTAGLGGVVGGSATGGVWTTSGSGTFAPNATTLNAAYDPSAADILTGSVLLTLTTTGQVTPCGPATAEVTVTIAGPMIVYSNELSPNWVNESFGTTVNFANTSPVFPGDEDSMSVTITEGYGGAQLYHTPMADAAYTGISFELNGGAAGGQYLAVYGLLGAGPGSPGAVYNLTPQANTWQQYWVPLSALGVADAANFSGFGIKDYAGMPEPTFYLDDVQLSSNPPPQSVSIDWNAVGQRIDGFGASSALNGGVWNGNWTPAEANMFFSTNGGTGTSLDGKANFTFTGIGLSFLRNRIAYASTTSANDIPTTTETTIMMLAQARGARLWSTPWTPAAGFKSLGDIYDSGVATGGGLFGGSYLGSGNNSVNLNYASQLANYVKRMKQGIFGVSLNIYAISIQNEPDVWVTDYEACQWTGAQIHDFATNLYNALQAQGLSSTKIILPENSGWDDYKGFADAVMSDTNAAADVGIIADHDYDLGYGPKNSYGKALWETEVSGNDPYDGSITNAIFWAGQIHNCLTVAQVNAWHYWWLIPQGPDNEALTDINGIPAKRMYALGQFSRFVRPNYYRVNATGTAAGLSAEISAYKDSASPNFAIVAINPNSVEISQVFNLANAAVISSVTPWMTTSNLSLASLTPVAATNSSFSYTLPPLSITTFVGQAVPPATLFGAAVTGNGEFHLSFTNVTGLSFAVFASTNLTQPLNAWSNVGTAVETPAGSGVYEFTDLQATNTQRFYQIRSP